MIKVQSCNEACITINQETFGDGTLKCELPKLDHPKVISIWWAYDNDAELFTLWSLTRYLKDTYYQVPIFLYLPYIPHARQDREVSNRLFTLKYFAELINQMDFKKVYVLDPHSDVASALINRVCKLDSFANFIPKDVAVMYPDNGAAKKYMSTEPRENLILIGNKHRNEEGRIDSYEIMNWQDGIKEVWIRDDICSYGGTFVAAAKELRARGVERIVLVVSHCENNIVKGEVFNYIDTVYTTDSIYTLGIVPQSKLYKVTMFR